MNSGRGIKRRGCLVASFLALMMVLAIGSPARAQTLDPLSTDISNCPTPAATPACATLAYSQCLWLNKPSLCAEVGAGDLVVWEGDLFTEAGLAAVPRAYVGRIEARFPEILKMVEGATVVGRLGANGMPLLGLEDYPDKTSHQILAVRRVYAERFRSNSPFYKKPIAARFIGTHEVLLGPDFVQSMFFRLEGAHWIITAFAMVGMDCVGMDLNIPYLWHCRRSPPIKGWIDYYPRDQWIDYYPIDKWPR
jgi:hypothetical protein